MIILEENFKWHLEAFASELFIYQTIKQEAYPYAIRSCSLLISLGWETEIQEEKTKEWE